MTIHPQIIIIIRRQPTTYLIGPLKPTEDLIIEVKGTGTIIENQKWFHIQWSMHTSNTNSIHLNYKGENLKIISITTITQSHTNNNRKIIVKPVIQVMMKLNNNNKLCLHLSINSCISLLRQALLACRSICQLGALTGSNSCIS